jgi:hypothetical protein
MSMVRSLSLVSCGRYTGGAAGGGTRPLALLGENMKSLVVDASGVDAPR